MSTSVFFTSKVTSPASEIFLLAFAKVLLACSPECGSAVKAAFVRRRIRKVGCIIANNPTSRAAAGTLRVNSSFCLMLSRYTPFQVGRTERNNRREPLLPAIQIPNIPSIFRNRRRADRRIRATFCGAEISVRDATQGAQCRRSLSCDHGMQAPAPRCSRS